MSEDSTLSRRKGGGATFPARRAPYFTFEHDETRRKGGATLPCQSIALYPEWGSPQNRRRQFCGAPGRRESNILREMCANSRADRRIAAYGDEVARNATQVHIMILWENGRRMRAEVRRDVGAEVLTTFRGGGRTERVYLPRSAEDAAELIGLCRAEGEEPYVLGGGSKTIVADGEVMRPVVSTALMRAVEVVGMSDEGVTVRAECGARLSERVGISCGSACLRGRCGAHECGRIRATNGRSCCRDRGVKPRFWRDREKEQGADGLRLSQGSGRVRVCGHLLFARDERGREGEQERAFSCVAQEQAASAPLVRQRVQAGVRACGRAHRRCGA